MTAITRFTVLSGVGLCMGGAYVELGKDFLKIVTIDEQNPMKVFARLLDTDCNGVAVIKHGDAFGVVELNDGSSDATFAGEWWLREKVTKVFTWERGKNSSCPLIWVMKRKSIENSENRKESTYYKRFPRMDKNKPCSNFLRAK